MSLNGQESKVVKGVQNLVFGKSLYRREGSSFASPQEIRDYLSSANDGLLLNGKNLRLSRKTSFQNVAVYGVTGKGKSTSIARPIILDKGKSESVLIVNDMA